MALQLAPWLQPPDYLSAIDKGSQMGLGVVKTNQQAWELNQRAAENRAKLQQDWATSMLNNQRMTDQNNLVAQSRLDTLGFNRQTQLETNAHNQATEDISAYGHNQVQQAAAATLAENIRNHNATLNRPIHVGPDGSVYNPQDGSVLFHAAPKDMTVNPLNPVQQADYKDLLPKSVPVVDTHWFGPNTTNAPTISQPEQARLQFYQNHDAKMLRQNSIAAPLTLQTNSVTQPSSAFPTVDAFSGEGNTGNNPPQLAPPMSLTNSPAGGTGAYKVGGLYGKMRYMGGDANNPSSWRQE